MAVAAVGVAAEMGVAVPDQLSLLAWDDSALCRLANPTVSAMSLDVQAMGMQVADCLLNLLAGGPVTAYMAPDPPSAGSPVDVPEPPSRRRCLRSLRRRTCANASRVVG